MLFQMSSTHSYFFGAIKRTAIISLVILFLLFVYRCPVKLFFGIDCPGCGLSRAFLSSLSFDFVSAFNYHPLFALFELESAYFVLGYIIPFFRFLRTRMEVCIFIFSLFSLIVVWIFKLLS